MKFLMYIWQLPQHLLGLLVIFVMRAKYDNVNGVYISSSKKYMMWGVSLGKYIIFKGCTPGLNSIWHERGHSIQSKYLGPLYLIVVGIPSFVRNIYGRIFKKSRLLAIDYYDWYYSQYPENWADKLGGVIR